MIRQEVLIAGNLPMTRERAGRLVRVANGFDCRILLEYEHGSINGKSLLGLLSVGRQSLRRYVLVTEGNDEAEAAATLAPLLEAES